MLRAKHASHKSGHRTQVANKPNKKAKSGKPSVFKVTKRLTLHDRLSQLTYRAAKRLLGDEAEKLFKDAVLIEVDPFKDIRLDGDQLTAKVLEPAAPGGIARVSMVETTSRSGGLQANCDYCQAKCVHVAATLATILESKLLLGLAEVPDLKEPIELLTERELILRALEERRIRATTERMRIKSSDASRPWTDYSITSLESGKSYHVSLRGQELGESFCSCPDFRTNHLGTCKHILSILSRLPKRFSNRQLGTKYVQRDFSLTVHYGEQVGLRLLCPSKLPGSIARLCKSASEFIADVRDVPPLLRKLEKAGFLVDIYPDAVEFIEQREVLARLEDHSRAIRSDPQRHPLRKSLLKTELLPYQLDGIAFAVAAGRAVLADDMGLGKTIQGIGVAELFAQLAGIQRVLVVCPASLKSQWASEIERFCNRSCKVVIGAASDRAAAYRSDAFFTIANYEQIVRDEACVGDSKWDLIILDEGQRIKNWESKTSRVFKTLKSRFALVLSGTPLENRLEDLYTVVGFVNSQVLGPAYRFFHQHRVVDDDGRVKGYRNLDKLRESLSPILLRRTRASVALELPERTTDIIRIRPTEEQHRLSEASVALAAQIAAKKFISEMDLLMIQKHLLSARMAANSTFLCTKEAPGYSSKLEVLDELLLQLSSDETRKVVIFSEWTTMLDLIEPLLKKHRFRFVRLDGSVPQKKRQSIVSTFQTDKSCRCIVMTNAGSTGLNLQSANTVINIDLPWNPAILEQRIARAHRMGQQNPVHVYLLVTEDTIEERMLSTLASKQELASASLDMESDLDNVMLESGMEALKRRLEKLVGAKPVAIIDQSKRQQVSDDVEQTAAKRAQVASAGGELLGAALNLVAQLVGDGQKPNQETVTTIERSLFDCVERDDQGRPQFKLTLPNEESLSSLAQTLACLLVKTQSN